jgi:uroporphyrinogen decarboxylase
VFDSWAGVLPAPEFRRWVIEPTRKLVELIKAKHPHVPVIGFPRGAGEMYKEYAACRTACRTVKILARYTRLT